MNTATLPIPVLPNEWLGMIGGGQLGRMFCHAAQDMGYRVAVLDPDPQSPAGSVADLHICAAYDDADGLDRLGAQCQAISIEFENVPAASLERLGRQRRVMPAASAVSIVQDRISEKAFIHQAGVPVVPYAAIQSVADLESAPDHLFPGILKAARLGYDGKGQARISTRAEALAAFAEFDGVPCVLEALVPLQDEISVVLARGIDGEVRCYVPSHNEHRDGILAVSTAALQNDAQPLYEQAQTAATALAVALDYYGVLCVEFFVLESGELLANEIAPRPHNSGHFTMNACYTSQFEQQVRTMAALPLGDPFAHSPSLMLNLLGDIWFDEQGEYREPKWSEILEHSGVSVHLYGKTQARPGRKMGHITLLDHCPHNLQHKAKQVADLLGIEYEPLS